MPHTFTCQNCGKIFPYNPRIKNQKYCSSVDCQNARRNVTNRKKLNKSDQTRRLSLLRKKRWRDTYPAHQYQKQYREDHPEYVKRNRELQRERNRKRQNDVPSMIVKTYAYMPVMQMQQDSEAYFAQKQGRL